MSFRLIEKQIHQDFLGFKHVHPELLIPHKAPAHKLPHLFALVLDLRKLHALCENLCTLAGKLRLIHPVSERFPPKHHLVEQHSHRPDVHLLPDFGFRIFREALRRQIVPIRVLCHYFHPPLEIHLPDVFNTPIRQLENLVLSYQHVFRFQIKMGDLFLVQRLQSLNHLKHYLGAFSFWVGRLLDKKRVQVSMSAEVCDESQVGGRERQETVKAEEVGVARGGEHSLTVGQRRHLKTTIRYFLLVIVLKTLD